MMVLERWGIAAILVVGLAPAAVSPGQTPSPSTTHRSRPVVVQPDDGAPPDQAVKPDESAPLAQTPNYDPPPPPPRPPDPDPPPALAPLPQETTAPELIMKVGGQAPPPVHFLRAMTPEEQQLEQDTSHLLTLVRELKAEVDKAGIDTLSLSALRKAEEIQRLSKNLRDRLKLQSQTLQTKTQ